MPDVGYSLKFDIFVVVFLFLFCFVVFSKRRPNRNLYLLNIIK
jgi:hypothetical protein